MKAKTSDKRDKINEALKGMKKKCPQSIIGWGLDVGKQLELTYIPIGIEPLDSFIGGGWPRRRFSVIGGTKGVGKSTLMLLTIAAAQAAGNICVYADLENTYDPSWAKKQGVDIENLIHITGETAEDVLDGLITLYDTQVVDLVVIDSVAALAPKGELETKKGEQRSLEDDTIALIARKLSQFFRIACGKNARCNCATILVAQVRTDIGSYGGIQKITGGNALAHYNSLTLMLRRGPKSDAPKIGEKEIGFDMVVKISKTKLNENEGQQFSVPFIFGEGVSQKLLLIREAQSEGLITKAGAWLEDKVNKTKYQGLGNFLKNVTDLELQKLREALKKEKK